MHRYLPPETQVVLVSATLPVEVLEMTSKFMTDPVRVLVKRDELTLEVRGRLGPTEQRHQCDRRLQIPSRVQRRFGTAHLQAGRAADRRHAS